LQRYVGKRHVTDAFYNKIKKYMEAKFPDKKLCIAYGSAYRSMKANGKGEISAPVGPMFSSCKRIFKDKVVVVDEFRSTMISWKYGTKKQIVYKTFKNGSETLHHSAFAKSPLAKLEDIESITNYNDRKQIQNKHRRGGTSHVNDIAKGIGGDVKKDKSKKLRYPEVRGLRFSPEDGMSAQPKRQRLALRDLDRDREAALTIARLCCLDILGLPRPYPFDRRHKIV
jgi:hypothetical protein